MTRPAARALERPGRRFHRFGRRWAAAPAVLLVMVYCDNMQCRVNTFEVGANSTCPGCGRIGFDLQTFDEYIEEGG